MCTFTISFYSLISITISHRKEKQPNMASEDQIVQEELNLKEDKLPCQGRDKTHAISIKRKVKNKAVNNEINKNYCLGNFGHILLMFFGNLRGTLYQTSKMVNMTTVTMLVFFLSLFVGAFVLSGWPDFSFGSMSFQKPTQKLKTNEVQRKQAYPLQCPTMITQNNQTHENLSLKQKAYPKQHNPKYISQNKTCPSYFKWIHEDLRYWKATGVMREMIERADKNAHFRVVIVDGKVYVEKYRRALQTRDVFTIWGIMQLLRWYPGRVSDLELLFDCDDRPVVRAKDYRRPNSGPPPLFRYCSDPWSLDIVFPDWSFWGWVETNIRPWQNVVEDIKEGNKRSQWEDRVPYAYWRGNPYVCRGRQDLLKCNVSDKYDWNTRLYIQDWKKESKRGYKESYLQNQCTHRYKIYIEGWAWSVSEKYILACDAMTLYVTPNFYDFYIRGMVPMQHYWPIKGNSKCKSLKFAVQWGNNHTREAQAIGEAGSKFIFEDLKMEYVYDYMLHLLNEYAKLLKFKPSIPPGAIELSPEAMACHTEGTYRKFMMESLVTSPSDSYPCDLPPPFDPEELHAVLDRKAQATQQVELWENQNVNKIQTAQ